MQKEFVFLYPIPEIINFEKIKNYSWHKKECGNRLNECVDQRYRQKNFRINWIIFDDCDVSEVIELQPSDKIIKVGLNFKTHIAENVYPDQDYILGQLEDDVRIIRIAGFHMWDCVDKLAKRAHEIRLDTLVDEDLTEFFPWRLNDRNFKTGKYTGFVLNFPKINFQIL
ncbi:hypothetical protein HY750_02340 [Candidatus Kuenenbacteria bacterium]|nr:hypothetical protein [Candidatus Kuenenbacteria bacterium]